MSKNFGTYMMMQPPCVEGSMLIRVETEHSYRARSSPKVSGLHRLQQQDAHELPASVTSY